MEQGFWKKLKKPIIVMAPMSGVTDEAFRLMFLKYGKPDVFWTEFVSAEGLFSKGRNYCLKLLEYTQKERPIVAQLFGCNPVDFERAANLIKELGFDGVDINMGCPDRVIEKQGAGAALIKNPKLALEIIKATKKGAGNIPVSVKTRLGYNKIQIKEWIGTILTEKPAMITIHLRTRSELYFSKAHWEKAKEIVKIRDKISPKTLILGNGDIKSFSQARQLIEESGFDGVMIGRALVGNPWFFSSKEPDAKEKLKAILNHAEIYKKFGGVYFETLKKHFHAYAKNFIGAKELREKLMNSHSFEELDSIVKNELMVYSKHINN
jgi:nifR3 family TIM-barrel protein